EMFEEVGGALKAAPREEIFDFALCQVTQRYDCAAQVGLGNFAFGCQPQQIDNTGRHLAHLIAKNRYQLADTSFGVFVVQFYDANASHFDIERRVSLKRDRKIRSALS